MIRVQLGPQSGTPQWARGSVEAWVLMRTHGLEVPVNWAFPDGIVFLKADDQWPYRAVWS